MALIQLEFFGVARSRAKVATVTLDVDDLSGIVERLVEQFPSLAEICVENGQLAAGWLLNINGVMFTRDLTNALNDGDNVLLIPAAAGG